MKIIIENYKKVILCIILAIILFLVAKFAYFGYFKLCGSCGRSPSDNILSINKDHTNLSITYSSNNGSLPPQYYREKTVTITTNEKGEIKGKSTIKDYSKVIEENSLTVSAEQLNKIINASAKINPKSDDNVTFGCTGGTSSSIKITQNGKEILATSTYNCADRTSNKSLDNFFQEAGSIVPLK